MFAIFLCIAIGHAFGDLQRVEIRKDELKTREDAGESLSPYVKGTVNVDQYLQSRDVHVPVQSSSSNETEKPSSPAMRSHVRSGAYEVKKSGQKMYLETREADTRSLLKHSDRHISAKKDSMKFRRMFPITSDAIRNAGKDFAIHARRSFRGKRELLDSFNRVLKPVFHPETHPKKNIGRSRQQRAQKKPNNTKLEQTQKEKILDVDKSRKQEAEILIITQSGSSRILAASYSAMQYLLNKLPHVLKSKMLITDHAEKAVLESYVKSQSVPPETLYAYNSAKKDERELLKRLLTDIPIILSTYKALRKGEAWNYTRFHDKFKRFFQQPSTALAQYESLKRDELASLDSFLVYSDSSRAPEGTKNISQITAETKKPQETERARVKEIGMAETVKREKEKFKERTKAEEAEKRKIREVDSADDEEAKKRKIREVDSADDEEAEKRKIDKKGKDRKTAKERSEGEAKDKQADKPEEEEKAEKGKEAAKRKNEKEGKPGKARTRNPKKKIKTETDKPDKQKADEKAGKAENEESEIARDEGPKEVEKKFQAEAEKEKIEIAVGEEKALEKRVRSWQDRLTDSEAGNKESEVGSAEEPKEVEKTVKADAENKEIEIASGEKPKELEKTVKAEAGNETIDMTFVEEVRLELGKRIKTEAGNKDIEIAKGEQPKELEKNNKTEAGNKEIEIAGSEEAEGLEDAGKAKVEEIENEEVETEAVEAQILADDKQSKAKQADKRNRERWKNKKKTEV